MTPRKLTRNEIFALDSSHVWPAALQAAFELGLREGVAAARNDEPFSNPEKYMLRLATATKLMAGFLSNPECRDDYERLRKLAIEQADELIKECAK